MQIELLQRRAANPGGRADGNRKQRGSRSLTAIDVLRPQGRAPDRIEPLH